MIAFTKSLGKETANKNIAVNCITPAAARTRIFEQMSQEHIDFMLSRIPRGRFLEVDEVSSMVAWLVLEENSFTTGACVRSQRWTSDVSTTSKRMKRLRDGGLMGPRSTSSAVYFS